MKYIVILGDGMADYPNDKLGGKTPLMVANKPNIDSLTALSTYGTVQTVPEGFSPGSDVANLSVMGFDPRECYTGRSPLEAVSIGVKLNEDDVTFRANLVTLSSEIDFAEKTMVDYSSGEISTADADILIKFLKPHIEDELIKLYTGTSYRHCLTFKNADITTKLIPPHDITDRNIRGYLPSDGISEKLLQLMKKSHELLTNHPLNIERVKNGKNPANCLWFWGAGTKPRLENFTAKTGLKGGVISAVDLIKGIALCSGMDLIEVDGATGTYETNFTGKAQKAVEYLLNGGDYVYIHMEAPDECGHQGDIEHKILSIELIDSKVVKYINSELKAKNIPFRMLIVPDHATPISLKTHTRDAVPFALYDSENEKLGAITTYTENACISGIHLDNGNDLLNMLIKQ